jgi:hypothetical protein
MAYWSWNLSFEILPPVARAIIVVVLALLVWGVFTVENDPFRTSKPVVAVNGFVKLALELAYFGFAIYCLYSLGFDRWSWIFSNLVLLHLAFSYQRIMKILKR